LQTNDELAGGVTILWKKDFNNSQLYVKS